MFRRDVGVAPAGLPGDAAGEYASRSVRYSRMFRLRTACAFVLAAAACGGAPASRPPSSAHPTGASHVPIATLERTNCFGWCPVYKVAVYRDGVVEYEGGEFVKTKGHATGLLGPAQIAALDDLFRSHDYLALDDAYEAPWDSDAPSAYTSFTPEGQVTKSVRHYLGDHDAPERLGEVEDGIDRIVNIEQWIGTERERKVEFHRYLQRLRQQP